MTDLQDRAELAIRQARAGLASRALPSPLARTYVQHVRLQAGQTVLPTWGEHDFLARFEDVVALLDLADEERRRSGDHQAAYRRAAEVLEWMAHPAVNTERLPLALLSAACYQLAGYPARATTALDAAEAESQAPLLSLLLRGDFQSLLEEASDASATSRMGHSDAPTSWARVIGENVASALGVIASDFRWGDVALRDRAQTKLDAAAAALRFGGDPYEWLLVRLSADVAREMGRSSLRPYLRALSAELPSSGRVAFEAYARQRFSERRILTWPSQVRGLERLALGQSFALCTPTGSGKTTVAEVALLLGLFSDDLRDVAPMCLYIVPTRALAAEVESKLGRALGLAGLPRPVAVTGLYGGTDWGPTDLWTGGDQASVLICTQEKAEALIRNFGSALTGRLSVVVIDEAHEVASPDTAEKLANGESRALRLEALVTRLKAQLGSRCQFIAMSAVTQTLETGLAQWMAGSGSTPVVSDHRSTRQVIGRLICAGGQMVIAHDRLDGSPVSFADEPHGVANVRDPFPVCPPAPDFDGPDRALAPYTLWAATHLVASRGRGQPVLVSVADNVRNWASWFLTLLDDWDGQVPTYFTEPTEDGDRALWSDARAAMTDYFGDDSREARLLERGVIVHYGRMPGRLPRLLVQLVERRIVTLVVATSGLSQGVNLPFETVIVPKLRRHDGPMPYREFWNLVGRAGRPGLSTEGRTLVVEHQGAEPWQRDRFSSDYNLLLREARGALETSPSPIANLLRLIRTRLGITDHHAFDAWLEATAPLEIDAVKDDAVEVLDSLDGLLVASLAEMPDDVVDVEAWLATTWQATFAAVASVDEAELQRAFLTRGKAVAENIYPDPQQRKSIYRTSLSPRDAVRVRETARELAEYLFSGFDYLQRTPSSRLEYVVGALEILASHPRFSPRAKVGSSNKTWQQVLRWWVAPDLAEVRPSSAQIGPWYDFVSTHFTYRLNWALGSALGAIQESATNEGAPGITPNTWPATGLPWLGLWLKDLVEWGTLDPVAAFLLARGGARTRPEAHSAALAYYADTPELNDEILAPPRVRDWAAARRPSRDRVAQTRPPQQMAVELEAFYPDTAPAIVVRVLPADSGTDRIDWLSPSGHLLATSERAEGWRPEWAGRYDFELDVERSAVSSRRY